MEYKPIEDYGLIGNLHTVALVGKADASIDYLCYPHFDSPILFGKVLDAHRGGHFSIGPANPCPELLTKQIYMTGSNILITRFSSTHGVGQVIDLMPVHMNGCKIEAFPWIIRKVEAIRGVFDFAIECQPSFDYGRESYEVQPVDEGIRFKSCTETIDLRCDRKMVWSMEPQSYSLGDGQVNNPLSRATMMMHEGQSMTLILGSTQSLDGINIFNAPETCIEKTKQFWQHWLSQNTYQGRWREIVERSALTLKLLTFAPTGAIIASPTTSIPEDAWNMKRTTGTKVASRNWDYRFVWIRDAAFTVYAFLRIGFKEEARSFMTWIEERCKQLKDIGSQEGLRVLYDIHGHHPSVNPEIYVESTLDHWEGYRGQGPVRIGNAAASQVQLDIYGELMDSVYLCDKHVEPISWDFWQAVKEAIVEPVLHGWTIPDHGIWEIREEPKEYVHSKVMAWVTLDRAIRLAQKRSLPGDIQSWAKVRDAINEEVMLKGWNDGIQSFTQYYGSTDLDSSLLIMPLVFFISPSDPRMLSTISRLMQRPSEGGLTINNLVFRFGACTQSACSVPAEGTFTMCSFWLAEALARAGEHDPSGVLLVKSREIFEDLLGYASHLGQFSEEIDLSGRALGNFPQAFTHLSLISAAFNINRRL